MNKTTWETVAERYQSAVVRLSGVQMVGHICGLIVVLAMLLLGLPVDQIMNVHIITLMVGVMLIAAAHSVNYMFTLFAISHISKLNGKQSDETTPGNDR